MDLLSVVPMPWRIGIIALAVAAAYGCGRVQGSSHELDKQTIAHDELMVKQMAADRLKQKQDNEAALKAAEERRAISEQAVKAQSKVMDLMKSRPAFRACKIDPEVAAAINEMLAQ
jgi:hypothetical protein